MAFRNYNDKYFVSKARWILVIIDSFESQSYFFRSIDHDMHQNLKELINW